MSPTACRKHRVCSTLTFYHRLRKYQHSPTDICLRAFCLYSKRQFLRKKYKNIRFCYVKSLYFRYTSKIKKFRTKNPDFGTFLYGIRCFGAFYTKLSIYRNFPESSPNLCVHSSSSYVSPSMLPLSSGDLIEWSLVCHSTLSYQKFCDRHSNHYDHPEELHQSVE